MAQSYTLYEVNEYIRRVIALNFNEPIWIECEINQANEKRGNYYLDLVQKSDETDEVIAQTRASIWFKQALFIKKKLGLLFDSMIQSGTQVKLNVNIEFHEKYGLSFNITDIDPTYTVGQLELKRQKIIERLKEEDLLYKNQMISIPEVIQRVAIISSETAAGYKDFIAQLQNNQYGYAFELAIYNVAVQGQRMEAEITEAIREINNEADQYDIAVVIRGGGSKLDLSGFDNYNIAAHIANCQVPIITGIGHEIDQTVSDLTAHTSLKTPTAVAGYIIDSNLHYESIIIDKYNAINSIIFQRIQDHKSSLASFEFQIGREVIGKIEREKDKLALLQNNVRHGLSMKFQFAKQSLDNISEILKLTDLKSMQKRGFIYTTSPDGKAITKMSQASKLKSIHLHYADGDIEFHKNKK